MKFQNYELKIIILTAFTALLLIGCLTPTDYSQKETPTARNTPVPVIEKGTPSPVFVTPTPQVKPTANITPQSNYTVTNFEIRYYKDGSSEKNILNENGKLLKIQGGSKISVRTGKVDAESIYNIKQLLSKINLTLVEFQYYGLGTERKWYDYEIMFMITINNFTKVVSISGGTTYYPMELRLLAEALEEIKFKTKMQPYPEDEMLVEMGCPSFPSTNCLYHSKGEKLPLPRNTNTNLLPNEGCPGTQVYLFCD